MGSYVNLCGKKVPSFYFAFEEFVGNSYTPKYRGLQLNFEERSRATS